VADAFGLFFWKTPPYTAVFLENGHGKAIREITLKTGMEEPCLANAVGT
jgi:hypothetical protein